MRIYLDFEKPVAEIEAQLEELRPLQTGEAAPAITSGRAAWIMSGR